MSKQSRNSKQNERFTSSIDVGSEIGVGNQTNSGKFESRYDRKGGKSMINLNTNNKVSMGDNTREYANFLAEIIPSAGFAIGRDSMNSSHMMIEISDVDIKDPSRLPTGKGNSDYHLNLKAPPAVVHKGRYGNSEISRPGMGSIVASARNELDNYSSAVPRARHSMLNTSSGQYGTIASVKKGYPAPGGKLSIGLPPMRMAASSVHSTKNLNTSGGAEHVFLYRSDEERQNMMKQINEQQSNYQRLLAK